MESNPSPADYGVSLHASELGVASFFARDLLLPFLEARVTAAVTVTDYYSFPNRAVRFVCFRRDRTRGFASSAGPSVLKLILLSCECLWQNAVP